MRRKPCASVKPMQLHLAGRFWLIPICRRGSQSVPRSTSRIRRRFIRRGPQGTQTIRRMLPTELFARTYHKGDQASFQSPSSHRVIHLKMENKTGIENEVLWFFLGDLAEARMVRVQHI